jgi:hypothetical protein
MRVFSNAMKTAAVAALFGIGLAATPALAHDGHDGYGYGNNYGYARCGDDGDHCRRDNREYGRRYYNRYDNGYYSSWNDGYRYNRYDSYRRDRHERRDCDDCRRYGDGD